MNIIEDIWKEIRSALSPTAWCNEYGRKNGIYGSGKYKGYDDDLDAFRHASMSCFFVAWNPI